MNTRTADPLTEYQIEKAVITAARDLTFQAADTLRSAAERCEGVPERAKYAQECLSLAVILELLNGPGCDVLADALDLEDGK